MARTVVVPIVTFALVSTLASPLLGKLQDFIALDPSVLRLTVLSTAVGALVVGSVWRQGLHYPPVIKFGIDRSLVLAVAACLVATGIAMLLAKFEGAPWGPPKAGALGAPLAVVLVMQIVGAAAEEVGWRGLVQPLLETRLSARVASLITGALFGLGHFYLAFTVSPASFGLFLISAIAISMILALATIGRSIGQRIAIATVLHFLLNMATLGLFADGDGSVLYFEDLALAFGVCGATAAFLLASPDRISPRIYAKGA